MRILVCGDREWTDEALVRQVLREQNPSLIIEGGARGADTCARVSRAERANIPTRLFNHRQREATR
jgi:hypothetical protein